MVIGQIQPKKKKKPKQTIEGQRTPEERETLKATKSPTDRITQFQEERKAQEAADPKLNQPSSAIKEGTVELPDGRVFSGLTPQENREIQERENVSNTGLQRTLENKPTLEFAQREEEAQRKEEGFQSVESDVGEIDRLKNLARAGFIPYRAVLQFANRNLKGRLGMGFSDEFFERGEKLAIENEKTRAIFATLGAATTKGVPFGNFKVNLAAFYGRSAELKGLREDAATLRETSEATLRSVRDSQDWDSGIKQYEILIEANRFKHSEIHRVMQDDPNSMAEGITDAADFNRDQNRLISDLGVLQRAKITGDPSELNRLVIALDMAAQQQAQL